MLDSLYVTKSKLRQALLALFFTNPSEKYYLRQLERVLGHPAGNIRRELLRFQNDGLFQTEKAGNLLYYFLNTRHPLFEELKSIVSKTVGIAGSLRKVLSSINGIRLAFIYGSFAAGREKATSDIDLMIIGSPDIAHLNKDVAQLERRLKREINTTVYAWEEYKARKRAKSGFMVDVLKHRRTMLIGKEDDL